MKFLNKLTFNNLKLNKKRTLVIIIGIVLATSLICTVSGLASSFVKTFQNDALINYGDWHAHFKTTTIEDINKITNFRGVKDTFYITDIGYVKPLKEWQSEYWVSPYDPSKTIDFVNIRGFNEETLDHYPIKLIKGRMPKKDTELVLTQDLDIALNGYYKIGDKVSLDVGSLNVNDDSIDNIKTKTYTIVGIIDVQSYVNNSSNEYTIINAFTYAKEPYPKTDMYVIYDDVSHYRDLTSEIASKLTTYDEYIDPSYYNYEYLYSLGYFELGNIRNVILLIMLIVIAIIMVTSILVIRNGFSISITERFKQFGLLSSVGATPKQIRKMILMEGLIIGLIAVPIGIIIGSALVYLLVLFIETLLPSSTELQIIADIPLWAIIVAALTSFLTIILSILIPARKVSKMPIIEAIRGNSSIKLKSKKLKTPKYIKSLFGIGGVISYKSLKRSRKKYRTTIFSIVVSIAIFIALYSVMSVGFKASNYYLSNYEYDLEISYYPNRSYKTLDEALTDQEKMKKIVQEIGDYEHIAFERNISLASFNPKDWHPDYVNTRSYYGIEYGNIHLLTLGDEEYKRYVESLGGNVEDYKEGAIILDKAYLKKKNKYYEINLLNVKEGDTLNLSIEHIPEEGRVPDDFSWQGTDVPIKVVKRTDKKPMSIHDEMNIIEKEYDITGINAIISDELYEKLVSKYGEEIIKRYGHNGTDIDYNYFSYFTTYIKTDDRASIKEKIDEFNGTREIFSYYDKNDSYEETHALIVIVAVFLYGFIAFISAIGITNIFNTITTNMALRSREFAMLRAIGMTDKEFNKMVRLESLLYGFKSLIIGIPIGIILSYLVHLAMTKILVTSYAFPTLAILLSIIFVFIIVFGTMYYSLNKINKQNIIDTIRNDNI